MALTPSDVSAVVCTLNSASSIRSCLQSLREAGVGELIVVDAHSQDGTSEIAHELADTVVEDPGTGLGNARNRGIARTTRALVLNFGSDNVMPTGHLQKMIDCLVGGDYQGVSAQTRIASSGYLAGGLNAWRRGRFIPGPARIIGTPTLFDGALLREHPYDPSRVFSDDSELCERWEERLGARFAISDTFVWELGKTSMNEVIVRCRMYGISDEEVFRRGVSSGWSWRRRLVSLAHPARADAVVPLRALPVMDAVVNAPFLVGFAALRYAFWAQAAFDRRVQKTD